MERSTIFHYKWENHHAINGKIHYFDWTIFNSKLLVHQRVAIQHLLDFHATAVASWRGLLVRRSLCTRDLLDRHDASAPKLHLAILGGSSGFDGEFPGSLLFECCLAEDSGTSRQFSSCSPRLCMYIYIY